VRYVICEMIFTPVMAIKSYQLLSAVESYSYHFRLKTTN